MLFEQFIDFHRPIKVFLIPPTRDIERRHRNAIEPRGEALSFPKCVIVGMIDEVVPGRKLVVEILRVRVRKRAQIQVPLVSIKTIDDRRHIGYFF